MSAVPAFNDHRPAWVMALADRRYDRTPQLSSAERAALGELSESRTRWPPALAATVARLTEPIDDVLAVVTPHAAWWGRYPARRALVTGMAARTDAFWAWDRDRWLRVVRESDPQIRQIILAVAYLVCGQRDLHLELRGFKARKFAGRVLGETRVDAAIGRVQSHMDGLGHRDGVGAADAHARADGRDAAGRQPAVGGRGRPGGLVRRVALAGAEQRASSRGGAARPDPGRDAAYWPSCRLQTQPSREEWLARSQAGEIDVPAVVAGLDAAVV